MSQPMSEKKLLTQFTREMMGSSVAHMSDEQLDAWMEPWRKVVDATDTSPGFPMWFIKRRNEARHQLLSVLKAKANR
jgi:hypothetical protein